MSEHPERPTTWADLTDAQRTAILDRYRAMPTWATREDEALTETAEQLYDSVEQNKRMPAFIAATMTPDQRAVLPELLESIAQQPDAHSFPTMGRRARQDLMQWVGELENGDPREAVSGHREA